MQKQLVKLDCPVLIALRTHTSKAYRTAQIVRYSETCEHRAPKYTIQQFKDWLLGNLFAHGDYTEIVKGEIGFDRNVLIQWLAEELMDKEDGIEAVLKRREDYEQT